MVFEFAFVLQGNSADELPEHVLGCARLFRLDFLKERPFLSLPAASSPSSPSGDSPLASSPAHGAVAGSSTEGREL